MALLPYVTDLFKNNPLADLQKKKIMEVILIQDVDNLGCR